MPDYQCSKCNKKFNKKSNYETHIYKKKKSCSNNNNNNDDKNNNNSIQNNLKNITHSSTFAHSSTSIKINKCKYCNKEFSRKYTLKRHIEDSCPEKEKSDSEKKKILNLVEEQNIKIKKLEELLMKYSNQSNTTIQEQTNQNIQEQNNQNTQNINSNNTFNIQNNNNVQLVAFGQEDLYAIPDKECKFYLNKGFDSVIKFIEFIHFNKNKPEFHNVYIPNIQTLYANIFNGKDWELKQKEEIINQLIDDKECFLNDKFKELFNTLDMQTKKKYQNLKDRNDEKEEKRIKKDIELLLYNNKKLIKQTKNKLIKNS